MPPKIFAQFYGIICNINTRRLSADGSGAGGGGAKGTQSSSTLAAVTAATLRIRNVDYVEPAVGKPNERTNEQASERNNNRQGPKGRERGRGASFPI